VIAHGLLGSNTNWRSIAVQLQQSGGPIFTVDLRNHGASPHTNSMTIEELGSDLIHYLDSRGLSSAHMIGHSAGGKAVMAAALLYPGRVSSMTVVDIGPFKYEKQGSWKNVIHIIKSLTSLDIRQIQSRKQADMALASAIPVFLTMMIQFVVLYYKIWCPVHLLHHNGNGE